MAPEQIQALCATVIALVAAVGFTWKFFRAFGQFIHLVDDMAGTPARRGVPARPGIMERMANVEASQNQLRASQDGHTVQLNGLTAEMGEQSTMLKAVSHEVHFNNGSSVKDSTTRTEAALKVVAEDVGDIKRKLAAELPINPPKGPEDDSSQS